MSEYLELISGNDVTMQAQIDYRKQKRIERQLQQKIKIQKLLGVIFIILATIVYFYLAELISAGFFLFVGIGLIRAKKQYIEF